MAEDAPDYDFLRFCRPGMTLKTRDRRDARITSIAPETGVISGEVQMMGPCEWRSDGRYLQAPAGAAGAWDLMPPAADPKADPNGGAAPDGAPREQHHESLAEALQAAGANPGCCD